MLAAYRTWRLIAEDDILNRPRRWLLRLGSEWEKEGDRVPEGFRQKWATFLTCVWCMGAWCSLAWWAVWQIEEHGTLVVATPFAISAGVGFLRRSLDPPDE